MDEARKLSPYIDIVVTSVATARFQVEITETESDTSSRGCSNVPYADAVVRISVRIAGTLDYSTGSIYFSSAS